MTDLFTLHPQLSKDCIELAELPLCKLLLCNDSNYPWFILVPRVTDITEIYQLEWEQQLQLYNESSMLGEMLMQTFNGDKLNVAALGNMVPQLHVHHIIRSKTDSAWPAPVWGATEAVSYTEEQLNAIKAQILPQIETVLAK